MLMAKYIVQHRRGTAEQWAAKDTIIPQEGELVIELDTENSLHKLKIGDGIHTYAELAYLMAGDDIVTQVFAKALPRVVTVTLDVDQWTEVTCNTDPNLGYYGQEVSFDNITKCSRLDLQPDADMIAEFKQVGIGFVAENKDGVITVYSTGNMPLKTYTMQATIIETDVKTDSDKIVGIPIGVPPVNVGGSDVGQTTLENGEIFNDYKNNKAIGEFSHAEGVSTTAGTYAFNILAWDETNKAYTLDSIEGLEVDDVFSIKWNTSHINYGKITAIDGNTITVDNIIINAEDFETKKLFIVEKPEIGTEPFDEGAHAEGYDSQAVLYASHAEGGETKALDRYAHAEGRDTQAGYSAHSEGRGTRALGEMSHAEGGYTEALGHYSHAEGYYTKALSIGSGLGASHAEGGETIADGQRSHAEGSKTHTLGYAAHAEGEQSTAEGQATHAEGFNTLAKQAAAHAEGWATDALGPYSHSEGYGTLTSQSAIAAHAEGGETKALAQYAHAEGYHTTAFEIRSHAEGIATHANGANSHAEGNQTTASGQSSHAEGELSDSTALASHAEGYDTTASGAASHSEGTRTVASGERAHAEGGETVASGRMSHAGGYKTIASAEAQTAIGKFNAEDKDALLIVGNGTSDTNRKNAFMVNKDGSAEVQTMGKTEISVATKGYVDTQFEERQVLSFKGSNTYLPSKAQSNIGDVAGISGTSVVNSGKLKVLGYGEQRVCDFGDVNYINLKIETSDECLGRNTYLQAQRWGCAPSGFHLPLTINYTNENYTNIECTVDYDVIIEFIETDIYDGYKYMCNMYGNQIIKLPDGTSITEGTADGGLLTEEQKFDGFWLFMDDYDDDLSECEFGTFEIIGIDPNAPDTKLYMYNGTTWLPFSTSNSENENNEVLEEALDAIIAIQESLIGGESL